MNKYLQPMLSVAAIAVYLLALRYVAPSREPYFILGIGVVGLVAWLCGRIAGLLATLALLPLTALVYRQFQVSTSYTAFVASPAYLGMQIFAALGLGSLRRLQDTWVHRLKLSEKENERLRGHLSKVQELGGIHSLCSSCKSIMDKDGAWQPIDLFLKEQTKMEFSHCICPSCAECYNDKDQQPEKI